MTTTRKGIVIGGGIGGLVAAIQLAAKGYDMTIVEQNATLGGKLQEVKLGDYTFDFGPSTITMPWIFRRVFEEAGEPLDPELAFEPLEVNSRNFFHDGTTIDLGADKARMEEQLASCSKRNREGFLTYLKEVTRMYRISEEQFFSRSFTQRGDFLSPKLGSALLSVHPFQTLDAFHRRFFDDPRLLAMMNRYATYVGSSPYQTPATLAMIAYLELVRGVSYIRGGNYRLIEAFARLARKKGVHTLTGTPVQEIVVQRGRISGVKVDDSVLQADFVISNVDYYAAQMNLLQPEARTLPASRQELRRKLELSSSGCLLLLGVGQKYESLHHHNLFFPATYGTEFADMFHAKRWPEAPALYVCNSSHHEPERAKKGTGSNLYVLMNAPAVQPDDSESRREQRIKRYRAQLVDTLSRYTSLDSLEANIEIERMYDPAYIETLSGSLAGALYGAASHGFRRTFFRPSLVDSRVDGLYYVGGSTHPGGGTPMVAISGLLAARAVQQRHRI